MESKTISINDTKGFSTLDVPLDIESQINSVPSIDSIIKKLNHCRQTKKLESANGLYATMCGNGLESHKELENYLIPVFVDCRSMPNVQRLFQKLLQRNAYSWSSLIQGYVGCGEFQHAIEAFHELQRDTVELNKYSYIATLKACVRLMFLQEGQYLHAEIMKEGLEMDLFIGSTLVDMYAKCGMLPEASSVLHELPERDVVVWTTLIAGYTEQGFHDEALKCFEEMQLDGLTPDSFAYICALKACGGSHALEKGQMLHVELVDMKLARDPFIASSLVDMYAKCGSLSEAENVFDEMQERDLVLWTTLISGYVEQGQAEKALSCYEKMQKDGMFPDVVTHVCVLKACGSIKYVEKGKQIHNVMNKLGNEVDGILGNVLVDLYSKCGLFLEACYVLNSMENRDVISWNSLIAGYVEYGLAFEALSCFEEMESEGTPPDAVTFLYYTKACGIKGNRSEAQNIHSDIVKYGFEDDQYLGNSLVLMSAKCVLVEEAEFIFDGLCAKDVKSWNALIVGYTESDLVENALQSLERMESAGVSPDAVTYLSSLKACGSIGSITMGKNLHKEISRKLKACDFPTNSISMDTVLLTALIHMYAKCGSMSDAELVFNEALDKDVVLWNALITAYALHGNSNHVFDVFDNMIDEGCMPNDVTFLAVLSVCSHSGLLDKGKSYFESMCKEYGIIPSIKHHSCMVDLLCRSGQLDEADSLTYEVSGLADLVLWSTMLNACRKWGNVEVGRQAFESVVRLDNHPAAFVSMSNIYVDYEN